MRSLIPLCFSIVFIAFSCQKENEDISVGSQESTLTSSSKDNFSFATASLKIGNTLGNQSSTVFVGGYNTSECGSLASSIFTTLAPSDLSFRIPEEGLNVNNVELQLLVTETYGNVVNQKITVQQLKEQVKADTEYNTTQVLSSYDSILGSIEINSADTGTVSIELNNSIGEDILSEGNVAFTTSEVFADIFKGLKISSPSTLGMNEGQIFGVSSSEIKLLVNCTGKISNKSYTIEFKPPSTTRSSTSVSTNTTNSSLDSILTNVNSANSNFYLQGLSSVSSTVDMSSLQNWYDSSDVLVNRAVLKIPVSNSSDVNYAPPTSITLHEQNSASSTGAVGIYDNVSKSYSINIVDLISASLISKGNLIYHLSLVNSNTHGEQAKLNGFSHSSNPATLDIYYTKY